MPILQGFRNAFRIEELRSRILFTLWILFVFRIGSHISLPGVNPEAIQGFARDAADSLGGFWAMMQVFSGKAMGNLALCSLGIMPYITASIIMQLMTKVSPTLEEMAKEGPAGQRKIGQYTRYLAIPICLVQGFFAAQTLSGKMVRVDDVREVPVLMSDGFGTLFMIVIGLTAGALFVMWLGEQITERGLGNGASVLIMGGIVGSIPSVAQQLIQAVRNGSISPQSIVVIVILYIGVIVGIVFVTQAQRRIPIQHAKHFRGRRMLMGSRNYMPLKVNTAGVMPVIFASSLMMVPILLARIPGLGFLADMFNSRSDFFYLTFNVIMIIFFSYFWTYLFFQPNEMANNLKEYGSFIPGIRPGETTAKYFDGILSRITLCGAVFLCVIALVPDAVTAAFGGDLSRNLFSFLGGTGVLIVVGVALDMAQKTESYLLMHDYGGFLGSGAMRGRR